jgi:hypothetical protein
MFLHEDGCHFGCHFREHGFEEKFYEDSEFFEMLEMTPGHRHEEATRSSHGFRRAV